MRHGLTRGVLVVEGDDAVAIYLMEKGIMGIRRIHAQGMVKTAEEPIHHFLDGLEIHHHIVGIQGISGKDQLNAAGMPMGKLAVARVFGEQVAAL